MPKDIIVYVEVGAKPAASEAMDILILSTQGEKELKTFRSTDEVKADYPDSKVLKKVQAMFEQPNTLASSLIRKVRIAGVAEPETPEALTTALDVLREENDDWYILLTDKDEPEYIKALAAWAESTEPTEAELGAGTEDYRKFYFCQTDDLELSFNNRRTAVIYTGNLEEHADAAYLGNVGPWYPNSVTWKFKRPDGLAAPKLTSAQRDALEEKNINFLTNEYKHEYVKNGVCADGEFIDVQMGADYLTRYMREELYSVFLQNHKIPYTDEGFALVANAVFRSLNRGTTLGIIATDPESKAGAFTVSIPKRAEVNSEDAAARRMPPIEWEAQLEGAVHSAKARGKLVATLQAAE